MNHIFVLVLATLLAAHPLLAEDNKAKNKTIFKGDSKELKKHKLLGSFLYIDRKDKRNSYGYEYYFTLTSQKGKMAYPVRIRSKKLEQDIRANIGRQFLVQAMSGEENIFVGEMKKKVQVLNIVNAKPIDLGSLGYASDTASPEPSVVRKESRPEVPTISGLNDTVTNSIILTGGAVLLGTILLGK